jgi:HSP90 family molecular chaperone
MASDYSTIRAENERRYGTDIRRVGTMLLANLYDDRTHFIFELLQNAEDAIRRRNSKGSGAIRFGLAAGALIF